MGRGLFLTLEGVEGVGKSTNLSFIHEYLNAQGVDVLCTREPGGTPLAEEIRELLLEQREEAVDANAELLLVFAARAQHLKQVVLPALERGQWVLCDRFTDATYAYQGGGRQLPGDTIAMLEALVQKGRQPDKTFFLDMDVSAGLARAQRRGEADRFESENLEFFEKVRDAYWKRIHEDERRFAVVDASKDLIAVQQQIQKYLDELLTAHKI